MNKIFRTIYNESLGAWVAISEVDSTRGRSSSAEKMQTASTGTVRHFSLKALSAMVLIGLASLLNAPAHAKWVEDNEIGAACFRPGVGSGSSPGTGNYTCVVPNGTSGFAIVSDVAGGASSSTDQPNYTAVQTWTGTNLGKNAIVFGDGSSKATGENSIAIGAAAQATTLSGVAVGAGSIANRAKIDTTLVDAYIGKGTAEVDSTAANTLAAFSVGSDVAGSSFNRQITNVAPGKEDSDAVNVAQLRYAFREAAPVKYFSVNSTASGSGSNLANDGANGGLESIAIGPWAYTGVASESIALGYKAGALDATARTAQEGVAADKRGVNTFIGSHAGENTVSFGNTAVGRNAGSEIRDVRSGGNTLFGASAGLGLSSDDGKNNTFPGFGSGGNTMIGNKAGFTYSGDGTVAIGNLAGAVGTNTLNAKGDNNIYMGHLAGAGSSSNRTIIIGTQAGDSTINDRAILIGNAANINVSTATRNVIALGSSSQALGFESIAFGFNTRAHASNAMALGRGAIAGTVGGSVSNDIAIGTAAEATGGAAIAQGNKAKATGISSIAIGDDAQALGSNSISIGTGNKVHAKNAGAFGDPTTISIGADGSYAVGNNNIVNAKDVFVMGNNVTADLAGSVVLGKEADGTTTSKYVQTTKADLNGLTYGDFAGSGVLTEGAVVSVGAVGKERQIKHVAAGQISATSTDAINGSQLFATNTVLGNVANTTKNILGGNATLGTTGSITMTNIGDTGQDTIHDAIKKVSGDVTNVEVIANMGWNISANKESPAKVAPGSTIDFSSSDMNIVITRTEGDMDFKLSPDLKIDNSITTNNFYATGETKLGDNFWVTKEGDAHYNGPIDQSTHIVNKEYVDNSIGEIGEIANKGWNLSTNGGPAEKVAPGATVDLANTDGNIVITQTGTKVVHNLSDNLKIGESITIGGDTTNQTVINKGGITSNTMNVGGGTMVVNEGSVTIKEGTKVDMGGNRITNVAPGINDGDAATIGQLKAAAGDVSSLRGDLRGIDRDARAGTASAAAMASLPQAYLPGKSMFAIATAGHRGQQGYAAGLSTISSSGKWLLKGAVSGNSRGHVTYGAGVGYHW